MDISKSDVSEYLSCICSCVRSGNYQISFRSKNQNVFTDYVFSEEDAREVILSLEVDDFSEAVRNKHLDYSEEILYIFGKDVVLLPRFGGDEKRVSLYIKFNTVNDYVFVISLHEQEYPLTYKFK